MAVNLLQLHCLFSHKSPFLRHGCIARRGTRNQKLRNPFVAGAFSNFPPAVLFFSHLATLLDSDATSCISYATDAIYAIYARFCHLQLRRIAHRIAQRSVPRKPRPSRATRMHKPNNFQAGRPQGTGKMSGKGPFGQSDPVHQAMKRRKFRRGFGSPCYIKQTERLPFLAC